MECSENWTHYLNNFRVEPCAQFKLHECQSHRPFTCFNWHFPNQRRRKPVQKPDSSFNYSPDVYCEKYDENTGICPDGDGCVYLHRVAGDVERKYHLRYYKTAQCVHASDSRGQCVKNGAHCAFAHTANDIRSPLVAKVHQFDQHETGFSTVVEGEGRERTSFVNEDPQWHSHDQVLSCYKTEPCRKPARLCRQGYACPYYHNSKDRRRPPATYKYRSTPCPAAKTVNEWLDADCCEAGDACQYCHTRTEQQFHPEIYKSTKCNDMLEHGYCPRAVFCAFAHHDSELHALRNLYAGPPSPKESVGFEYISPTRYDSSIPINNGVNVNVPSYSSVLQKRIPINNSSPQGFVADDDSVSSSYPKAPGPLPVIGNFEFQPHSGDQRLRAHSLNMGHLDMLKRNMMLNGGLQMDRNNPALTSHSSLGRSDSIVNGSSLDNLEELRLELPPIEESGSRFSLFHEASLDPFGGAGGAGGNCFGQQQLQHQLDSSHNQIFANNYHNDNDNMGGLQERCEYLEDMHNRVRQAAQHWQQRFDDEHREKNQLLMERNNLLGHIDQLKFQLMQFVMPVGGGPQTSSPLSISLPRESYDGGIRPSASLPHSPPYNIFENESGAPACPRCGHDRSQPRSEAQSGQNACPVCSS